MLGTLGGCAALGGALAGCADSVDGAAQREQASPAALLQQVLPTAEEVGNVVGNPLDAAGPAKVGALDVLPGGIRDSSGADPLECLGAVTPLMRVVYESGDVTAAAWRDYSRFGADLAASSAEAGVVRFGSATEAKRMFDRFARQWQSCEGTTVTLSIGVPGSGIALTVTDVRVDGPILSATIVGGDPDGEFFPTEHAVGLSADSLVDADVAVTGPAPTQQAVDGRAVALVQLMLDKLRAAG